MSLSPALTLGERISVRVVDPGGAREVIGFVTALSEHELGVIDRRGVEHVLLRTQLDAARRVPVSLGRNPATASPELLDALAARAGLVGRPYVARISELLAGRTPPPTVAPWGEWASFDGFTARFEGEWVTIGDAPLSVLVDAAWWATRMGARSVQVRADATPQVAGLTPHTR